MDEAYADYVEDPAFASMIPLVRTGADVIVSRTFSKAFGMAGLRIGYALAHPKLLQKLADFCSAGDMWLGALSVRAALAGIGDEAFVVSSRRRNAEVRADTVKALRALGLVPAESHTNFVYFRVPGRLETLRAALEARGVLVGGRPNPMDAMRVTIGRPDEMRAFHVALRDALSAA